MKKSLLNTTNLIKEIIDIIIEYARLNLWEYPNTIKPSFSIWYSSWHDYTNSIIYRNYPRYIGWNYDRTKEWIEIQFTGIYDSIIRINIKPEEHERVMKWLIDERLILE